MSGSSDDRPKPHSAEPSRPRPQYGEYATPEEQRARIKVPDASAALAAGEAPVATTPTRPASIPRKTPAALPSQRRMFDRVLTIGLLGFGLFNVVTGIPTYLDYPTIADAVLRAAGVDAVFTNLEQGRVWGLVAALAFAALWFVTAVLSYLQLRRERLAFWIPIVGALVAGLVVGICLTIPLFSDPAVVGALLPTPTPTPTP